MTDDVMLCWGTVNVANVLELITAANAGGFGSISVAPHLYAASRAAGTTPRTLREALDFHEVRVAVIEPLLKGLPAVLSPDAIPIQHRHLFGYDEDYCYAMAQDLGARAISLSHFLGSAVPVVAMIDAIGPIVERARQRGFAICIEFIPDTGIDCLGVALEIYDAVADDHFGIILDAWHFARSGSSLDELTNLTSGMIAAVQLCDRVESNSAEPYAPMTGRLLPGEGELPLAEVTRGVLKTNPNAVVGVEVFSSQLQSMSAVDAAVRAGNATRDVLARV